MKYIVMAQLIHNEIYYAILVINLEIIFCFVLF